MYMLVAFLAFLGGFGGKSAKNVECAKGKKNKLYLLEKFQNHQKRLYLWTY